jgi:hypothetical protein
VCLRVLTAIGLVPVRPSFAGASRAARMRRAMSASEIVKRALEEGVITSFNDYAVFVRYGADTASKSTQRADLEWVRP